VSTPPPTTKPSSGATLNLVLATLAMAMNFWAWAMLGPLAPDFKAEFGLSPTQVSIMVAVPVLIGSLGRIVAGALTDRFGGRLVFSVLCFVSIVPTLFLAFDASSYAKLIAGGFVLGIAGTSFAVGVPFVNAWYPPERRGFALGVYGFGNIGSAIAGFAAPRISDNMGQEWAFLFPVIGLAAIGTLFLLVGRNAPTWQPNMQPAAARFKRALQLPITRDLSAIYAITFGGFVAFGAYLPTFLKEVYELSKTDAASRAAGFVVLATIARPVGGWLSDRVTALPVLMASLSIVAVGAVVTAFEPQMAIVTVALLTMAFCLGLGNGAVFALVGRRSPSDQVGAVTGLVGAAGGLGGFLPPIVMGLVFQATDSYAIGLMLLSDFALAAAVFTYFRIRPTYFPQKQDA
jgi:NNP family nitrate/nitrite transporter-like MFS transporter